MTTSESVEARKEPPAVPGNPPERRETSRLEKLRERLRELPLRKRLATLQLLASGVALGGFALFIVLGIFARCYFNACRSAEQSSLIIASSITAAANTEPSVAGLRPLFQSDGFRAAAIYGEDGHVQVKLETQSGVLPDELSVGDLTPVRSLNSIRHLISIASTGTGKNAILMVDHSLGGAWLQASIFSMIVLLAGLIALLTARTLHRRLYRVVTEPFVELRSVINGVRADSPLDVEQMQPRDRQIKRLVKRLGGLFRELVGSSRVDLQACKLEYSIVSPK